MEARNEPSPTTPSTNWGASVASSKLSLWVDVLKLLGAAAAWIDSLAKLNIQIK